MQTAQTEMYYIIFIACLAIGSVHGQDELFPGKCPSDQVTTVNKFDARKFEGVWYQIQRYSKSTRMDCVKEQYEWEHTSTLNGYQLGKYSVHTHERNLNNDLPYMELDVISETIGTYGKGQYFYPRTGWPFWVVDTDYESYAVVWGCWEEDTIATNQHKQQLKILARDWRFDVNSVKSLQATLAKFDKSRLKTINHDAQCWGDHNHSDDDNQNNNNNDKDDGGSATSIIPRIALIIVMILCSRM